MVKRAEKNGRMRRRGGKRRGGDKRNAGRIDAYGGGQWAGESSRKPRRPRPYSRHCEDIIAIPMPARRSVSMRIPSHPGNPSVVITTRRGWAGTRRFVGGRALAALGTAPTESAMANLENWEKCDALRQSPRQILYHDAARRIVIPLFAVPIDAHAGESS